MYDFFLSNGTDKDYQGNPDHWDECDLSDICYVDPNTVDLVHGPVKMGDE
jgi:hypothetical protein